jgi:hypothetical protein
VVKVIIKWKEANRLRLRLRLSLLNLNLSLNLNLNLAPSLLIPHPLTPFL